jgi:hydrogenase-4 component B
VIGLAPFLIVPLIEQGISAWAPGATDAGAQLAALAPMGWITIMGALLLAATALVGGILWRQLRHGGVETGPTWGCGYVAPTPRMQYTSSSFAQMLVGLFSWALRPHTERSTDLALFPKAADFRIHVPETVLDEAVLPAFGFGARFVGWFRVFQQGSIQTYVLYIVLALIALLLWR